MEETRNEEIPVASTVEKAQEKNEQSRPHLLNQIGLVGAGLAGLAIANQEAAAAGPADVEDIRGKYEINQNFSYAFLFITQQNGNTFQGVFEYGNEGQTPVTGTVSGKRPGPVTIFFNRIAPGGTVQMHVGAGAMRGSSNSGEALFLAGVFYGNGSGPYPWTASATAGGLPD